MANPTDRSSFRKCAICGSAAFFACAAFVLFTTDLLLAVAYFSGWIVLGVAAISLWAMTRARMGTSTNWPGLVLAHLVLFAGALCYGYLALVLLAHTREKSVSVISSSNLRAISYGLQLYCEANGAPPVSLNDLVRAGISTPDGLVAPLDPSVHYTRDGNVIGSSFVYRPASAACTASDDDIVAYEREPWTPRDVRVFPQHCRQAITRSGKLLFLDDADFERLR